MHRVMRKVIYSKCGGRENTVSNYPIPLTTLNVSGSPKQPGIKSVLFEFHIKGSYLKTLSFGSRSALRLIRICWASNSYLNQIANNSPHLK